jgi:hypothetical protein
MVHSSQLISRTPEPRSPRFKSEIIPEDLPPQGHLDDTPQGHLVTYADPVLAHPTPQHTMFEDLRPTPQRLGSAFHAPTPVTNYQTAPEPRFEHLPTTPCHREPVAHFSAPLGPTPHEPKIKEPEMFSGHDPSKLYGFLAHCKMAF